MLTQSKHNFRHDFSGNLRYISKWHNLLTGIASGHKTHLSAADVDVLTNWGKFSKALSVQIQIRDGAGRGQEDGDFCGYESLEMMDGEVHRFATRASDLTLSFDMLKNDLIKKCGVPAPAEPAQER